MLFHASTLLLLAAYVNAHGALTATKGGNGLVGQGFGINPATPRDGTGNKPFQQDTSIIKDREIQSGKAGFCGRTQGGGNNDVQAQLVAASNAGLPSVNDDGSVTMTIHQVNGDGAGPYKCDVSASGNGDDFVPMQVTTNVPGIFGLSRAKATDFPLTAMMPAGVTCKGGPNADACVVRCRNPIGPFGGCTAVTDAGATPQAGGNTAPAPAPAPQTGATTTTTTTTEKPKAGGFKKLGALFGNRRRGMRIMAALKRHEDDSIDDDDLMDLLHDPEVELDEEEI